MRSGRRSASAGGSGFGENGMPAEGEREIRNRTSSREAISKAANWSSDESGSMNWEGKYTERLEKQKLAHSERPLLGASEKYKTLLITSITFTSVCVLSCFTTRSSGPQWAFLFMDAHLAPPIRL